MTTNLILLINSLSRKCIYLIIIYFILSSLLTKTNFKIQFDQNQFLCFYFNYPILEQNLCNIEFNGDVKVSKTLPIFIYDLNSDPLE